MDQATLRNFETALLDYYRRHGRHDLPWRSPEPDGSFNAYKILVSEVMLQQTQVPRVVPKFASFIQIFPTVASLAGAALKDVLIAWQGLGYNRRARFLWLAARLIVEDYGGAFPKTIPALRRLPGVGVNTAGAVLVYAFNEPALFIETNIRTVFIRHFFQGQTSVPDKAIMELVDTTLDRQNPREFYWALMDYGTHLKQTVGNLNRTSTGYTRQSKFAGSERQIRGRVLQLLAHRPMSSAELAAAIADDRLQKILQLLEAEGLIQRHGALYDLP